LARRLGARGGGRWTCPSVPRPAGRPLAFVRMKAGRPVGRAPAARSRLPGKKTRRGVRRGFSFTASGVTKPRTRPPSAVGQGRRFGKPRGRSAVEALPLAEDVGQLPGGTESNPRGPSADGPSTWPAAIDSGASLCSTTSPLAGSISVRDPRRSGRTHAAGPRHCDKDRRPVPTRWREIEVAATSRRSMRWVPGPAA